MSQSLINPKFTVEGLADLFFGRLRNHGIPTPCKLWFLLFSSGRLKSNMVYDLNSQETTLVGGKEYSCPEAAKEAANGLIKEACIGCAGECIHNPIAGFRQYTMLDRLGEDRLSIIPPEGGMGYLAAATIQTGVIDGPIFDTSVGGNSKG